MVTLKDIAEKANLSITTVSRVINYDDTTICSKETRELIWSISEQLGYIPRNNRKAVKESAQKTHKIACILSHPSFALSETYGTKILQGIEEGIKKSNHVTFSSFLNLNLYTPESLSEQLIDAEVTSVIWIGNADEPYFQTFVDKGIHVVMAGMEPGSNCNVDYVGVNFYHETLKCLREKVHSRFKEIGYIGITHQERYRAFIDSFKLLDKQPNLQYIIPLNNFEIETAKSAMKQYIDQGHELPEVLFAASDSVAIGTITALKERGYEVPRHVRVLGFDNIDMASYTTPRLSTIEVPAFQIGMQAVQIVTSQVMNDRTYPIQFILPAKYIERDSL